MKLIILALLIASAYTLNYTNNSNAQSEETEVVYTFSSPTYYSYTPVYYSYVPATYYYNYDPFYGYYGSSYYSDFTYVVYPFYYRGETGSSTSSKGKKEATKEDMNSEMKNLKKEIWGKENFDTSEIRISNKAYDSRWLIAQLKISRALELEDNLRNKEISNRLEVKKEEKNQESSTKNTMRNNTEYRVEEKLEEKVGKQNINFRITHESENLNSVEMEKKNSNTEKKITKKISKLPKNTKVFTSTNTTLPNSIASTNLPNTKNANTLPNTKNENTDDKDTFTITNPVPIVENYTRSFIKK